MNYGVPYMGSKNRIAKKIIDFLPEGEVLVDLFGGGGAITHCAALSNKWNCIIYNELNTLVFNGFKDAVEGKFDDEKRWISRDDFFKLKDTDFYVACCFSFGNSFKSYMYGKPIEPYKKAYHYAVVFNDWTYMGELFPEKWIEYFKEELKDLKEVKARRIKLPHLIVKYIKEEDDINASKTINNVNTGGNQCIQNIERSERLQDIKNTISNTNKSGGNLIQNYQLLDRLQDIKKSFNYKAKTNLCQRTESLERLKEIKLNNKSIYFSNQDYRKVEIPEGAIVYCDIPYEGTGKYTIGDFDYDAFYKWVEDNKNKYKIFVSSYELPEDKFEEVWSVEKNCKMAKKSSKKTVEKIFIPK